MAEGRLLGRRRHLMDAADREKAGIARLQERRRELEREVEARIAELEVREQELRDRIETADGLAAFLGDEARGGDGAARP